MHLDEPVRVLVGAIGHEQDEAVERIELGALPEVGGVLHGERMEGEDVGEHLQVAGRRLVQVEPEELALGEVLLHEFLVDVVVGPARVHEERGGVRRLLGHGSLLGECLRGGRACVAAARTPFAARRRHS